MNTTEYIEAYFTRDNSPDEKREFENRILMDEAFADEVSFYISSQALLKKEQYEKKRQQFREIYDEQSQMKKRTPVISMWKLMAAATVAVLMIAGVWFAIANKTAPRQMAEQYIGQNFQQLGVTMGRQDSISSAVSVFNDGKLREAAHLFEALNDSRPADPLVEKYLGVTYLRLGEYDQALKFFNLLASHDSLFSNPGVFYRAITLLRRNQKGDKEKARQALQEVVDKNLEGRHDAAQWLRHF